MSGLSQELWKPLADAFTALDKAVTKAIPNIRSYEAVKDIKDIMSELSRALWQVRSVEDEDEAEASLIKAGIKVESGRIRKSDLLVAIKTLAEASSVVNADTTAASSIEPEFMGKMVEALEAKGYKLAGSSDMWRHPSVEDHTSTNVVDAGGDKLVVMLRFGPDGKKVTQRVVDEGGDDWYFDYTIKDQNEIKTAVSDVCKSLKCKLIKFEVFQNIATIEMTKPEGLDIPFRMMAR